MSARRLLRPRILRATLVAASVCLLSAGCATTDTASRPPVATFIDASLDAPPFDRAVWGVLIEDQNGKVLFERNAGRLMIPASVRKLFTTYTAVECLGADATLRTELRIDGTVEDGVLRGDLILRGGGDPSLGGRYFPDPLSSFDPLIEALRARGVRRIEGDVVGDGGLFEPKVLEGTWEIDDVGTYYTAPVAGLGFSENVVDVYADVSDCRSITTFVRPAFAQLNASISCDDVEEDGVRFESDETNGITATGVLKRPGPGVRVAGDVAVRDPVLWGAQALHDALLRNGIEVGGKPRVATEPGRGVAIGFIESPPLFQLGATVLEISQNLYADALLKASVEKADGITWADAVENERRVLEDAGLAPDSFRFQDGSGLSADNLVAPRAVVDLLRHLDAPARRGLFRDMMASPGDEGTLRRRLLDLKGRLWGKTGTLSGYTSLAGILERKDGSVLYFAMFANHHTRPPREARDVIEAVVRRLAE